MAKHRTLIVTDSAQVPDGYVPVTSLRGKASRKWKTVAKAISDAHAAGEIRAVKLVRCLGELKTGRVFVHPGDTDEFLRARWGDDWNRKDEPVAEPTPLAVKADCDAEWPVDTLRDEVFHLACKTKASAECVERLTDEVTGLIACMNTLRETVSDLVAAMQLRTESTMAATCDEGDAT